MKGAGTLASCVSVVVPFFGAGWTKVERLLASVAAQDYPGDREIIVIDNNLTPVLVPGMFAEAVRLLHEPEPGSYAARNAGLRLARGMIIAFTDSDCTCSPNWLTAGAAALAGDRGIGAIGGAVLVAPVGNRPLCLTERYDQFFHMRQAHYVSRMGFAATANLFVRREVIEQVGPFDRRLRSGGDREWCARLQAAGHRLGYCAQAAVHHEPRRLPELLVKSRRLAGQEMMHARLAGRGLTRALHSDIRFYLARTRRLFDLGEPLVGPERIAFGAIGLLLELVRVGELLRLGLMGGESERR